MYQINKKIIDQIMKEAKGKKHLKLNIGLMIEGETILKTFDETGEIEYENNIYEIGSITKTFTASLLAKYVWEKKVQLNDTIGKYIPNLDPDTYYPTLKRLASHTSGYTEYQFTGWKGIKILVDTLFKRYKLVRENPTCMNYETMLKDIQKHRMHDKDYKAVYSNFGIGVLGYVLGSISGLGYWDTMNEYIKTDLGLSNTFLSTQPGKNLNGFSPKNENWGNYTWDENNLISPAGALSSTAEDMLQYAKMNITGEREYFTLCHEKYASLTKDYDMGLGWWLHKKNNNIVLHGGTTGCFDTFVGFDKEKKTAVVFLPNYRWGFTSQLKIGSMILMGAR